MNAIKAIWTNGQILPLEPIEWPEGTNILIEPVAPSTKIGLDESEWRDDPESIKDWNSWADSIEPLMLTDEERAAREHYREEHRRFNIEAVRKQMGRGRESVIRS